MDLDLDKRQGHSNAISNLWILSSWVRHGGRQGLGHSVRLNHFQTQLGSQKFQNVIAQMKRSAIDGLEGAQVVVAGLEVFDELFGDIWSQVHFGNFLALNGPSHADGVERRQADDASAGR